MLFSRDLIESPKGAFKDRYTRTQRYKQVNVWTNCLKTIRNHRLYISKTFVLYAELHIFNNVYSIYRTIMR